MAQAQPDPPDVRLAAIAARHGATIVHVDAIDLYGQPFRDVAIECEDNDTAIAILNDLADDDATYSTKVRGFAAQLARAATSPGELARRIHRLIRDRIRYVDDESQVFRSSDVTLLVGAGNCVNTARLVMALARAGGLDARIVGVRPDEESWHACAQIKDDAGAWRWAECTVGAAFGEEPVAAAVRLGVRRADIRGAA